MNRDLFMAILSMDTYNRGYGVSVNFGPNSAAPGTSIGNASIFMDAIDASGAAQAAGFYAIAYDVSGIAGIPGGTRVVMYRGSDTFLFGNLPGESGDVWSGYGGAAGDGRITRIIGRS